MSGSIFPSDQSGLLGVIIGLIAMVMFGVLLTLLIDGNFTFGAGSGRSDPAVVVQQQEARIAELGRETASLEARIRSREEHKDMLEKAGSTRAQADALHGEETRHRASIAATRADLAGLALDFAKYRDAYRRQVWRDAAGTKIEEFASADGKVYQDVIISRVSEVGLRIKHRSGTARLTVGVLPPDLRERFLLDEGEANKGLALEAEARRHAEERLRKQLQESAAPESNPDDDDDNRSRHEKDEMAPETKAQIAQLHLNLAKLRARQSQVGAEISEAQGKAAGVGRDRSVPGSLDTWAERLGQLQRLNTKLSAQVNLVEAELVAKDPDYRRSPTR